jgi:hypothetical protein
MSNTIKGTVATTKTIKGSVYGIYGKDGLSAYELAVKNGFVGTEQEWIASLKGKQGERGEQGKQGIQGVKGDKGDTGNSGVYLGSGEMPEDCNVQIDPTGEPLTLQTPEGTVVSQNADFAEVAEWADGNPDNEDRTGYFVCASVPLNGIVMKKAKSTDDVKGVTILAPAFAGNYTKDKLDSNGNLKPKYSYVAIIGFVPVRDKGRCTVGGRCMPDDDGCAIPSSNSMGYQVVSRIDENRVLIIIEPNGDMVQRIKTQVKTKIGYWKQNTEYKIDDVCMLPQQVNGINTMGMYICHQDHKSSAFDLPLNSSAYWDEILFNVEKSYKDIAGNVIHETYATKKEVGNIETALDNIISIQNQLIGGGSV